MADTKISDFGDIPVLDLTNDRVPILDVSGTGIAKNKLIAPDVLMGSKLDLAGGTMTGALRLAAGTNAAPSVNFGDSGTGFYKYATNNIGVACNGNMRWFWSQDGTLYNSGAPFVMSTSYGVMPQLYLRTNGLCLTMGASDDVRLERAAAASLQLGSNHATTPTTQTIKAHNVTTGTGADLSIEAGVGSVSDGVVNIGRTTSSTVGFFNANASAQIDTSGSSASHNTGTGSPVYDDDTFDGYTLAKVVAALRSYGLLA